MKNTSPPPDNLETMAEAYQELLAKALQKARQTGTRLYHVLSDMRHDIVAMGKIGDHEVVQLEQYVKRDLQDAAHYLADTGKELTDWLGFDATLVERTFWDMFSEAANKTTTELLQIRIQAAAAGYHTGELAGLGTLVCDQCGEQLHFHKPGHIPPCPRCRNTHFKRQTMT
ncbi:MAG: zinc ribbon-containing protein [Acidiferrobacter sp.]